MQNQHQEFERAVWPHLRGAYNLARWLLGNDHDAEDVVQESFFRAFRAIDRVRGEDARAWLLAIVRNTALNYLQRQKPKAEVAWSEQTPEPADRSAGPETSLLREERRDRVRSAIERLPVEFRAPLVLRKIKDSRTKRLHGFSRFPWAP